MELLIPGLILVALMVWASTRIKRNAAAAFDAESIETEGFTIEKPEGFLHVLNDDSGLAFRAYSKEFGKVGNKDVRMATIEIERHAGANIGGMRKQIKENSESLAEFETYIDGGEKAALVRSTQIVGGGEFEVFQKLVTRGSNLWDVRCSVLTDNVEELSGKIELVRDSVRIK
jgi:hypothetical protein